VSSIESSSDDFVHFPDWATLRVFGPDAASWLNGLVTCNVLSVGGGRGAWGTLLTKQGKIAAELQIVGDKDELFLAVSGGDAESIRRVLEGYLVMEEAEIESSALRWVVFGESAQDAVSGRGFRSFQLPWTHVPVFVAFGERAELDALRPDVSAWTLDPNQWHEWTLRHGVPRFGADYDERDNLHAASLERRTVDWQKGCYLGQEVVCMQDMRGKVKKRLVLLHAESGSISENADLSTPAGEVVGQVTSFAGEMGIATVHAPHFETGTILHARNFSARVAPLLA
jgi:folate-binding protein YgfZ